MPSWDDIAAAAAGEERDALWRSVAEDMEQVAGRRRGERGFVQADRPADLARALGRHRRARLSTGTSWGGDPGGRRA